MPCHDFVVTLWHVLPPMRPMIRKTSLFDSHQLLFSGNNVPGWTDLELVDREQLSGPCSIEAAAVQDLQ